MISCETRLNACKSMPESKMSYITPFRVKSILLDSNLVKFAYI